MNLLQRVWGAVRSSPPQALTWENLFPSRYVSAGVSVNEHTALDYSPVWAGVSTHARDIAKLPLVLNRNLSNGGSERFKSHRLYRILHDEWNPEMTSYKARETMQALCLLYGNAYAEIVRDDLGRPAGMYPIIPTRVTPMRDEDTGRLFYRVTNARGRQSFIQPQNMIHISSLSTDGIIGHGIVEHAKDSIGLGIAAEKFGGSFFGNGTTFGGIVEVPALLTGTAGQQTIDNTRAQIEAVHQGVERAHKILILGAGSKFHERGTKPNEAQFIESRKFQVTEVARWLNMPAHKLGDLENAHFTNIEEQELQYWIGLAGWLTMWEQELARKLIAPLEYAQQSITHVMEGVLRGNSSQRADFYTKLFNVGAITVNRILQLENMNPIGPEGDVHLVPLNMIPLERYGEWIDAQIEAKKAPKELPAPKVNEPQPAADDRALHAIAETRASLTALVEQDRTQQAALLAKVTAKLDDELREHAETTTAAIQAQTEADARADADRVAKEQAEQDAASLRASLTVAEEAIRTAIEARDQATAQVEAAQKDVLETAARASVEAQRADTSAQERAVLTSQVEEATRQLASRQEALDKAQQDQATAVAGREALQAKLDASTATITEFEARKANELDRLTRVVAAHRALIVDVSHRVLKPEMDRARRHQVSPDSLRKWADAFYQTHRDVCADALYPVVLTHLAWSRSTEDPRVVAEQMAADHCEESRRQLQAVIDGSDHDEFHAALERLLLRWEAERPAKLADKVLTNEISYIRSLA